jgi:DNA repair protein SbcC/Rad50
VVAYIAAAKTARAAAQDAVTSAKQQYASFTSFRDHSVSLAQQLRELATQILHNTPAPEKCPLCHTHFAPGELLRHMQLGVDQHVEARGQALLAQLRQCEEALHEAVTVDNVSAWLAEFCERAAIDTTATVHTALLRIDETRRALDQSQRRLHELGKELQALQLQGMSPFGPS